MCDAVVVGGGPIGIETAIELRRANIDAHVVEAGPLGHTISWWAPQTRWFSSNDRIAIAGVPLHTIDQSKASREEYLTYLRSVVDQFQVPVQTFARVDSIASSTDRPEHWRLRIGAESIDTPAVILAIGGTDRPNRLKVPGEDLPHVDGYLRETHRYHGRRVLIVGGRNSAVEAAIRLHRAGAKVTLSYHRDELPSTSIKYWLRPEIDGLIRSGAIEARFNERVTSISQDHVTMQNANKVTDDGTTATVKLPFDDVLTLIGYVQDKTLFQQLGIELQAPSGSPLHDPETMQTNLPGVYVAGTAIGGTQSSKYQVFLENCHEHATKITRHLLSVRSRGTTPVHDQSPASTDALQRQISLNPES